MDNPIRDVTTSDAFETSLSDTLARLQKLPQMTVGHSLYVLHNPAIIMLHAIAAAGTANRDEKTNRRAL